MLPRGSRIPLLVSLLSWSAGEAQLPSEEEFGSFARKYDGASRPDLVPTWIKIEVAISDADSREIIERTLTMEDATLLERYVSTAAQAHEEDSLMITEMIKNLCLQLDELDTESIGEKIEDMDETLLVSRNTRAKDLVDALSNEGARILLAEADRKAGTIGGAKIDSVALARAYPDFARQRYKERCRTFGFAQGNGL